MVISSDETEPIQSHSVDPSTTVKFPLPEFSLASISQADFSSSDRLEGVPEVEFLKGKSKARQSSPKSPIAFSYKAIHSVDPNTTVLKSQVTARHSPATNLADANSAYSCYGSHNVLRKLIWAKWFLHRSAEHLLHPPPSPPGPLADNTLFVLINTVIEADIRARRPPEVVGLPPALAQCLTIWIWKDCLKDWEFIQYGDTHFIDGEDLALSLGGASGLEPRWVLSQSLRKKGFPPK